MNRCRFIMAYKPPTVSDCRAASTSTRPSGTGSDEHHAYCKDFVQKHDYEAYLVSQFYPTGKRNGYFAIKAFYVCL
jgi:NADH dehydrogenase [ubiquinone] 1 alpha subcomplex assembly factor 6